jgi:hypothetical protein
MRFLSLLWGTWMSRIHLLEFGNTSYSKSELFSLTLTASLDIEGPEELKMLWEV